MIGKQFKNVGDVAAWRLCMGCGACACACPENNIRLVDMPDHGIRPIVNSAECQGCGACVKVCPGIEVPHQQSNGEIIGELLNDWGPVLEVWEGYAQDPDIRFKGSSGGLATALALFCLEKEHMTGVLHIGAKPEVPLQNMPVFSRTKNELLAYTGSRYSPAAPCEKLNWIKDAKFPCVFIGKPCDVAALRKLQTSDADFESKVGLAISIFCAGTPTTRGTLGLLEALRVKPDEVKEFRYRGCGWPGTTTAKLKRAGGEERQMTYEKSWSEFLNPHVQFRCRICPDSTGELADISCGDPWYREIAVGDKGYSLVLARTRRGREVIQAAIDAGYVQLTRRNPEIVAASQMPLLNKRRSVYGRLLAMRCLGLPVPEYSGFNLRGNFACLGFKDKVGSVLGTVKRIITRGMIRPLRYESLCKALHS